MGWRTSRRLSPRILRFSGIDGFCQPDRSARSDLRRLSLVAAETHHREGEDIRTALLVRCSQRIRYSRASFCTDAFRNRRTYNYGVAILPRAAQLMGLSAQPRPHTTIPAAEGKPISPDRALEIARATFPGAVPIELIIPPTFFKGPYSVRMQSPSDTFGFNANRLSLDPQTGAVLSVQEPRTAPAVEQAAQLNLAIHTGEIFGMPGRIVMSLASLMVVVEVVSGFVMWWKRRAHRRPRA